MTTKKTRRMTTTSDPPATATCCLSNEKCVGGLFQCTTCKKWFCTYHTYSQLAGVTMECVACDRDRTDAKLLNAESAIDRLAAKVDPGNKLDIADK